MAADAELAMIPPPLDQTRPDQTRPDGPDPRDLLIAKMCEIAGWLGAHAQGDDGEYCGQGGRPTRSDRRP